MDDIQEQLLTEITTLKPTDFVRVVSDPITLPDSAVMKKSKFVDNLFGDIITPVVNGAVNDWAPTGLSTAHTIRIFPSGPASISGMTGGVIGRTLILYNVGTSLVTLLDDSALSTAANRFQIPGTVNDFVLVPDMAAIITYDSTLSRWRVIGATSSAADAWNPLGAFFTFVSVDGATTNVTIAADVTGKLQKGMRLRYVQSQSLTAYWNFDSNSISQVGSFTAADTAMTYTAGKFSNAATFNGTTSKIVITDNVSLKPTGEFTVGLWVKATVSGANQRLVQSYSANTAIAGWHVTMNATSGTVNVTIGKNTGTVPGIDYTQLVGLRNIGDGALHYVVITFRNNYLQIYVDGILDVAGYSHAPVYAATNYVQIGMGNNTGADVVPLNGQVDDLFLINGYALDEQTIRAKYAAQTAQGTSSLTLTKYGIVTDVGLWNGTNTPVTFWGGTDFSSVSGTFGTPYYSTAKCPTGFNASPRKWSVVFYQSGNITQTNPVANTFYNLGSIQIVMPIGVWTSKMFGTVYIDRGTATTMACIFGISTSASSVTDTALTGEWAIGTISLLQQPVYIEVTPIAALTKTTYYFLGQTTTTTVVNMIVKNLTLQFVCAYL